MNGCLPWKGWDKWAEGKDPKEAARIAWTCSASPDSGVKLEGVIEVLEKRVVSR